MPFTDSVSAAPRAGHALHLGLAAELALGADLARHARDLVRERRELVDHRVHRRADAEELALHRLALDRESHLAVQVAVGHGLEHRGDLGGGPHEVVDQRVQRLDARVPAAAGRAERGALVHAALAPDHPPHAPELLLHARVHGRPARCRRPRSRPGGRGGGARGGARSRRRGPPRARRGSPRARPARCRRRSRRRAVRWRFGRLRFAFAGVARLRADLAVLVAANLPPGTSSSGRSGGQSEPCGFRQMEGNHRFETRNFAWTNELRIRGGPPDYARITRTSSRHPFTAAVYAARP